MNNLDYLPLLVMPVVAAVLGFLATANLFERPARLLLGLLAALVAFGIGQVSVDKSKREGHGWLQLAYIWFAIVVAAGFILQRVIGSETAWPAALALTFAFRRLYQTAAISGTSAPSAAPPSTVIRGPELKTFEEIRTNQDTVVPSDERSYSWGGQLIPRDAAVRHFLVVGTVGSGKTITIRMLMEQVLPGIKAGSKERAVIFDAKGEMAAVLAGMDLGCNVYNMNPFDQRGWGWKLREDFPDSKSAFQLAKLLYPDPPPGSRDNEFFTKMPRALIAGCIRLLQERTQGTEEGWTLRDVICACRLGATELKRMLESSPDLKDELQPVFRAKEYNGVAVSISAKLAELTDVAAYWEHYHKIKRELSLAKWPEMNAILLLPTIPQFDETLKPCHALLVQHLANVVLSGPEDRTARSWFFLDELPELSYVEGVPRLVRLGRSKGVAAVLGFQSLSTLEDPEKAYGKELTNAMLGMVHTRAYLQLNDSETGEWASRYLQENDQLVSFKSWSPNQGPEQPNMSEQIRTTRRVSPEDLRGPVANTQNGLHGWYSSTDLMEVWKAVIPAKYWPPLVTRESQLLNGYRDHSVPKTFKRWTKGDLERLKLPLDLLDDDKPEEPGPQSSIFDMSDS